VILSIDPGKRHAGCALFDDKELACAWLVKANKTYAEAVGSWGVATAHAVRDDLLKRVYPGVIEVAVIEKPVVRKGHSSKISNDCVDLAIMGGAFAGVHCEQIEKVHFYIPEDWKGQVPKGVMIERIQSRLDEEEFGRVDLPDNKKRQTDVWDAVGIGLKYIGRL